MKKYFIVLGLVLLPFAAKASLMGFMDGMGLWDETGKQQYTCFADNTCLGLDNKVYQKPELLGVNTSNSLPATSEAPAILPTQVVVQPLGISGPGFDASTPAPTPTPTPEDVRIEYTTYKHPNGTIIGEVVAYAKKDFFKIKSFNYSLVASSTLAQPNVLSIGVNDGNHMLYEGSLPSDYSQLDGKYVFTDLNYNIGWTGQDIVYINYSPYTLGVFDEFRITSVTYQSCRYTDPRHNGFVCEGPDRTFTVPLP